jgi:hypothetical protein
VLFPRIIESATARISFNFNFGVADGQAVATSEGSVANPIFPPFSNFAVASV